MPHPCGCKHTALLRSNMSSFQSYTQPSLDGVTFVGTLCAITACGHQFTVCFGCLLVTVDPKEDIKLTE